MIIPKYYVQSDQQIAISHLTPNAQPSDPVAIMCHPTGFCSSVFSSVSAFMRDINVFAIDMRSHGYSDRGNVTNWGNLANDLQSAITKIKEISGRSVIFGVGISSGSSALILHASTMPETYKGLYLSEPILFPPGQDLSGREILAKSAGKRRETFPSIDDAYIRFGKSVLSELSPSALALYCVHGFRAIPEGITLRCNRQDEQAIYISGGPNGVFEALQKLKVPCVIAYGQYSKTINKDRAKLIAQQISNCEIELIEQAGHFTLFDRPYNSAKKISAFIKRVQSSLE